jgi:hypothetical protein
MLRRLILNGVLLMSLWVLIGCGGGTTPSPETNPTPSADTAPTDNTVKPPKDNKGRIPKVPRK